ncbi:MAG: SGNH/GDSL hydrolase family protein [Chloroflexi bacterium]|nr:SGNH/GDSL hydrolase family protein [Chloroflexota bacterium]
MKTILCYGDSNTWGYNPATMERFSIAERWTGVLAQELGAAYRVVEEGLNGRTTVWDDPIEGHKNGKEYLIPCLESHKPIDLVTILLGTNDLKTRFSVSAYDIAMSAGVLVEIAQKSATGPNNRAPQVLLMSPPVVGKLSDYAEMFDDAQAKSAMFAKYYAQVARQYGCHFLDTAQIVVSSDLDGIHWEASEHRKLGQAVAARVKELFRE